MELSNFDVIERVLVSKKSQHLLKTQNKICLRVKKCVTKPMIKQAVESIWSGAKVEKVAVITVPGRTKRFMGKKFKGSSYKKAVVSLQQSGGVQSAMSAMQGRAA